MRTLQKEKDSVPGKWSFSTVAVFCAVLIIVLIFSLSRILNKSTAANMNALAPTGSLAPTNLLTPEEIEKQHAMYQPPAPAIQTPVAAQPAVIPNKQHDDEVKLQKARTKVNQRIVERMKQYVRDNPNRYNRELEEQIKRRENQGAPIQ